MPEIDEEIIEDKSVDFNEKTATITDCISTISTGVYGEDVRSAIATGMSLLNNNSTPPVSLYGDLPNGDDLNLTKFDGNNMYGYIYRLLATRSYLNKPSDFSTGQIAFLFAMKVGSNIKQFIFYAGGGSTVIGKFHMRIRNKVNNVDTWSNWITVDLLNVGNGNGHITLA